MMDERAERLLAKLLEDARAILEDKLSGFYVHGSLAFGCFRWETSDIDFLPVVRAPLTLDERMALIQSMLRRTPDAPKKGLEMSVVLEMVCRNFEYPTPYELHFSNSWLDRCREDPEGYCRAPGIPTLPPTLR